MLNVSRWGTIPPTCARGLSTVDNARRDVCWDRAGQLRDSRWGARGGRAAAARTGLNREPDRRADRLLSTLMMPTPCLHARRGPRSRGDGRDRVSTTHAPRTKPSPPGPGRARCSLKMSMSRPSINMHSPRQGMGTCLIQPGAQPGGDTMATAALERKDHQPVTLRGIAIPFCRNW